MEPQRTLTNAIPTSRSSAASALRHQRRPSTNPSVRSSTSSLAPSTVFSTNSSYDTPRSSLGQSTSLPELPENITCSEGYRHAHWCTYGEHLKPTYTCEGWKRHEREHEVPYVCMPDGPVIETLQGKRCVLCSKIDPDDEHLAKHRVSICVGKFGEPLKKSRKTDMIKHLAKHRVHSEVAATLAEQWRYPLNKKYFSCGLCVGIFATIMERSNHIDNEHWTRGQNMGSWDVSNCIRGLLLEREVQAAWRTLLRSNNDVEESNLRWETPLAENLQLRLEKAEEPPFDLAKAALQLSNYGSIRPSEEGSIAAVIREGSMLSPYSAASRNLTATTMAATSDLSRPQNMQPCASTSKSVPGLISLGDAESSNMVLPISHCNTSPASSALFDSSFQTNGFHNDTFLQPGPVMDLDVSGTSSLLSTCAFPPQWSPIATSQSLHNRTQIQGHLMDTGALLVAQMSSPRHGQLATYEHVDRQGQSLDSRYEASTCRVPTSNFFYGSTAQNWHHGNGFNLRDKPLPPEPPPDLPDNAIRAAGRRSTTPMDLGTG